jgi:hypothetical protein
VTTATLTARMQAFDSRPLTSGEMMIVRFMFGDETRFVKTRVIQSPRLGFGAMVPSARTIFFSQWAAAWDFTHCSLDERGWFVHELVHVWQALNGRVMPVAKLSALGAAAYIYQYEPGKPFSAYNIEQQAELGRHLFLARNGRPAREAPKLEALEEIWPAGPATV